MGGDGAFVGAYPQGFRIEGIGADRQETHFARGIGHAAHEIAADDQPAADTRSERHIGEIVDALPLALPAFAERGEIDVVFQDHVEAERLPKSRLHVHRIKIADVRRQQHPARPIVRRTGYPHDGKPQFTPRDMPLCSHTERHSCDLTDQCVPAGRLRRLDVLRDDLSGKVGDGDPHLGTAEIDSDDIGGIRYQFIGNGGPADMPGGPAGLAHPPFELQPRHDLRNGLLGKAGLLGDGCARDGPALNDGLDHSALGKLPGNTGSVDHGST